MQNSPAVQKQQRWSNWLHTNCWWPISWTTQCSLRTGEVFWALLAARMDQLLDISGIHRSTQCIRCKAFRVWQTCWEHHKALCSRRTSFCMDYLHRVFCSTIRMILFLVHSVRECTDTIRVRTPGKLIPYIPAREEI